MYFESLYSFCLNTERLKNGEKASDLVWESWYDTLPEPLSVDSRSSIASYLSVFSSTSEEVTSPQTKSLSLPYSSRLESRSIPPSPTFPQKIPVSITRSKSDEANLGKQYKELGHFENKILTSSLQTRLDLH